MHVPYFTWAQLGHDAAKREYLRLSLAQLLRDNGVTSASSRRKSAAAHDDQQAPAATTTDVTANAAVDDDENYDDRDKYSTLRVAELRTLCVERGVDKVVSAESRRALFFTYYFCSLRV